MKDGMDPAVVTGVFGLIAALLGVIGTLFGIWLNHRLAAPRTPKSSLPFGEAVLKSLDITDHARKKLRRAVFIHVGGTGAALFQLVENAKPDDSILAICGYKGDFAKAYYRSNFKKFNNVTRVFSYEAILSEITNENTRFALDGLLMHINKEETDTCNVEALLITAGWQIKDIGGSDFDPPLSFGLVIVLDVDKTPQKAIVHWELDARPLRHLIAIEGVIIDNRQKDLLNALVELHEGIVRSNLVSSSTKAKDSGEFETACADLKRKWDDRPIQEKGK